MPVTGTAPQSSKKTKSKTTTPAEDTASTPPVGNASTANSLTGLPIGSQVRVGMSPAGMDSGTLVTPKPVYATVQYTKDAPYTVVGTMSANDKATLLLQLGSVPGLYTQGQAPTADFIRSQGAAISFRQQDYDALTKMMVHGDYNGQSYTKSLQQFVTNPALSAKYFGKVTTAPKVIPTTPQAALIDDINARFQDLFETPADKKLAASYAKEYNKAELAAGGAGLTQTQRDNIFNKYVEQTALSRYSTVKKTPGTADDAQLEAGALGQIVRKIRGAYADNGIAASEKQVYIDALAGMRSSAALTNKMQSIQLHAATQFPALKDWISKGNTVKDYLNGGYIDSYAKIYGIPANQVTVDKFYDVGAGTIPMSVKQWEESQWKNPLIKQTDYYKNTIKNDLRATMDAFGIKI